MTESEKKDTLTEPFVITDLRNGIGNILLEILDGLFFANSLSKLTGKAYRYYALLTPRVLYGHQIAYTEEHHSMPHPLKLSEIYPNITFINQAPSNTLNINLERLIDISLLAYHPNNTRINITVNNLMNLLAELGSNMEILPCLRYDVSIVDYVKRKFNTTNSLGIHLRLFQIGDYMRAKYPSVAWYNKAVQHVISQKGNPQRIYVVSGVSSAQSNSIATFVELILMLQSNYPLSEIIVVDKEPYYVDLVILNLCSNLVITNTTFSLASALLTLNEQRLVVYPDLLDANHFQPITLPGFHLLPTEKYIQY